jgi:hypothetical protein
MVVTEPQILHYCAWQNVSIGVWVGQATTAAVKAIVPVAGHLSRSYPTGHSSIAFILDKLPAPAPEANELMARIFGRGSELSCVAIVLEGTGFWASGLRSMIANMHRAARGSMRVRIATSIEDVLGWFPSEHARLTGIALDTPTLRSAMQYVRGHGAAAALG